MCILVLCSTSLLVACDSKTKTDTSSGLNFDTGLDSDSGLECTDEDVILSVTVERKTGGGYTYDDPVDFGEASIATFKIYGGHQYGEFDTEYIIENVLSPVTDFPIFFCMTSPDTEVDPSLDHIISVELNQDPELSTVGDMINENHTSVNPPDDTVVVYVSGLESCESEDAGGFCI